MTITVIIYRHNGYHTRFHDTSVPFHKGIGRAPPILKDKGGGSRIWKKKNIKGKFCVLIA